MQIMNSEFGPYIGLANAIVAQAVEDYSDNLADLELDPRNGQAALEIHHLEKFFHSRWYATLTTMDPDYLITGARALSKKRTEEKRIYLTRIQAKKNMDQVGEILSCLENQDELTPEQRELVKNLCLEAVDLTEKIPQMQAEAERYGDKAAQRMGLRV